MAYHWLSNPKAWLYGAMSLLLVLIVACGAAEEGPAAEPAQPITSQSVSEVAGLSAEKAPAPAAQRAPSTGMSGGTGGSNTGAEAMTDSTTASDPAPTAAPAPQDKPAVETRTVDRLEYAIGAVANESNRPWAGSRQAYVLYDPILEYAIGVSPTSSEYVPELATKWEASDDLSEWTFHIRPGVEFHNGWGELTADDFLHTSEILTRPDSRLGTPRYFIGGRDDAGNPLATPDQYFKKIDDHTFTIVFHGPDGNPATTFDAEFVMSNASSEMGPWSRASWESGGTELEAREANLDEIGLQGTASYQYVEIVPAEHFVIEKTPGRHWTMDADDVLGEDPDFNQIRIRWIREDAPRQAALLAGEAHMADLPLDLQKDSASRGLKLIRSQFTANNFFVFFGGMYLSDDPKDIEAYDPTVPWADTPWAGQEPPQPGEPGFESNGWKVRRAMNKAINREELLEQLYKDIGELMYVGYYHPSHYGWDDTWPERYETMYKYNPEEASQLLAEAGYNEDNPVKVTVQSYVSPGEAELPQAMEAIANYWQQVGIEVEIEDLDGATVRQRYRGREMQHRVWPNIIIYFPLEYGNLSGFTSTFGRSNHYQDNWVNRVSTDWRNATDFEDRDRIAREWGNYAFESYMTMPLFWFPHTIVVDPTVVDDWVFPGSTVPRGGHLHNVKAAAK